MCLEACRGDRALIQLILAGHRQVDCKNWIAELLTDELQPSINVRKTRDFTAIALSSLNGLFARSQFSVWRKNNNLFYITVCGSNIQIFFQDFHIEAIEKEVISQNSIFWTSLQPLSISNLSCFSQNHPFLLLPHLSLKRDKLWEKTKISFYIRVFKHITSC